MGMRRAAVNSLAMKQLVGNTHHHVASPAASLAIGGRRWKSADAGDVIGIDLGTTNSCVAIMVRKTLQQ